jgi:3-oxochol-4-en-24-oyl-CoA dehydrogenase
MSDWADKAFAAASAETQPGPLSWADEADPQVDPVALVALTDVIDSAAGEAGLSGVTSAFEGFGRAFSPLPLLAAGVLGALAAEVDLAVPRGIAVPGQGRVDAAMPASKVSGEAERVLDGPLAQEVLLALPAGAFLVKTGSPSVEISALPSFDQVRHIGRGNFDEAAAERIELAKGQAPPGRLGACLELLLAAESVGIAEWAIRDAAAFSLERHAFGRPIGAYQGVAHQLADTLVGVAAARALLRLALAASERDPASFPLACSLARERAARAAVDACERSIQVHGARGYRWDRGIHLRLRRAQTTRALAGGRAATLRRLVDALRQDEALPGVELLDDEEQAAVRAEATAWVEQNLPAEHRALAGVASVEDYVEFSSTWARTVNAGGWPTLHWPQEFGGEGRRPSLAAIAVEVTTRAHPRRWPQRVGLELVAESLMLHGTDEQRERFLPGIRDDSVVWTQGYSEPAVGSDLAALTTTATPEDGGWRIDGEKIWSSIPTRSDRYFLLARTGPPESRHRGITCFLVDLDSPGIDREAIRSISDQFEFGRAVLRSVFVPDSDRLGPVDGGWKVVLDQLRDERTITVAAESAIVQFFFDRLLETVELLEPDGAARDRPTLAEGLAEAWMDLQALRIVNREAVEVAERGEGEVAAETTKLLWSRVGQQVATLGLDALGEAGTIGADGRLPAEFWRFVRMETRSYTIYAGSTEILLSLLAEDELGLPRSR